MRRPKIIIAGIAVALAAAGGATAAVAASSAASSTFVGDGPSRVNGQGVQNFLVATPGIAPIAISPASGAVPAPPSGGYGGY